MSALPVAPHSLAMHHQDRSRVLGPILETENLTKRFPQVVAVDRVSFDICRGEVHCLLGENGAGKSTLSECLYGSLRPDSGRIIFKAKEVRFSSPSHAIRLGIGMVHQHFVLVPPLTVLENIVMGLERGFLYRPARSEGRVRALCDEVGVDLAFDAKVEDLSIGQQQWVEILKALYAGVELLILDEPTAVQTPQETDALFAVLRRMRDRGLAIIVVTHKLHEVMQIADRVTVLRHGRKVATVKASQVTPVELARMMVGRAVDLRLTKRPARLGRPLLQVHGLSAADDDGQQRISAIELTVRAGEILGIAGVSGNGQKDLFETLVGVRKARAGRVLLDGDDITNLPPKEIMARGLSSIPEDRIERGLVMTFPIEENLILGMEGQRRFRNGPLLDYSKIRKFAWECLRTFGIKAPSPAFIAAILSGGNLQRLILARELSQDRKCIVASQPTRGLDVGGMEYVRKRLLEQRDAGRAVLLIADDLDEVLELSDRIAVMYRGRIVGMVNAASAERERIGLMMAGMLGAGD